MQISKGKISLRQSLIIVLLAIGSPSLRILPTFTATISKQASWLAPLIAIIPMVLLIFMYRSMFKKYPDKSLDEVFEVIAGKFITKVVMFFYMFWILFLLIIYLRYFCERFLSTILTNTPIEFMLLIMLGFIFFVLRNSIEALARFSEFFVLIFAGIMFLIFFVMFPQVKMTNLLPITYYDLPGVSISSLMIFSILAYITYVFFLGDKINGKDKMVSKGLKYTIVCVILISIIILLTIGYLGASLTTKFPIPFFTIIKSVEILNTIERVESVFIAMWVVTDCIILSMFAHILLAVNKRFYNLNKKRSLLAPILLISYIGALYIANNEFELHEFSQKYSIIFNFIFGALIPFFMFIVGKIRKKI